jgi:hypothetical protein
VAPPSKVAANRVIFSPAAMPVAPQGPAEAVDEAAGWVAVAAGPVVDPAAAVDLAAPVPEAPAHGPAAVPA